MSEQIWELGVLSRATTDHLILEWFAGQHGSHTPGDWLDLDGHMMWLTADVGEA